MANESTFYNILLCGKNNFPFLFVEYVHSQKNTYHKHLLLMREVRKILILVCHIWQINQTSPTLLFKSFSLVTTSNFLFSLFLGQETKTWKLKWSHRQKLFDHFKNKKNKWCRNKVCRKMQKMWTATKIANSWNSFLLHS